MDIRSSVLDYLLSIEQISNNAHAVGLLRVPEDRLPGAWRLPVAASLAVGQSEEEALPAAAAMASGQIAIILIDDLLDEDPRGTYREIGSGETANLASSFQAAASEAVLQSPSTDTIKRQATTDLTTMFLQTSYGQYLDSLNPNTEDAYWAMVYTKSSPFFATAFSLGACLAKASQDAIQALRDFGALYGVMIQINDDLHDSMTTPAGPDWLNGRFPLPILYAATVDHTDRERFSALRSRVEQTEALEEAQDILISSGAVSYCVDTLLKTHEQINQIISDAPLANPDPIYNLIEELIRPARHLIENADSKST